MPTLNPTPAEMEKRIVRAKTIQPKKRRFEANGGIPAKALESIAADSIYLYMAPGEGVGATSQNPGVVGFPGLTVNVCRCPVGQGPDLHAHARTLETFMCLDGQFEVIWGDQGQYQTVLDAQDMISVPPNVMRAFRNTGKTPVASLLVLIQGEGKDMAADVQYAPATGEKIEREFGGEVRERIENMGWRFDAQLGSEVGKAA
jgi:mannose-6-phosphate isomerase-like protein (cupin superfamily)